MSRFSLGDRVRIRKPDPASRFKFEWLDEMDHLDGTIGTVRETFSDGVDIEENPCWFLHDEWLRLESEPVRTPESELKASMSEIDTVLKGRLYWRHIATGMVVTVVTTSLDETDPTVSLVTYLEQCGVRWTRRVDVFREKFAPLYPNAYDERLGEERDSE